MQTLFSTDTLKLKHFKAILVIENAFRDRKNNALLPFAEELIFAIKSVKQEFFHAVGGDIYKFSDGDLRGTTQKKRGRLPQSNSEIIKIAKYTRKLNSFNSKQRW